MSDGCNEIGYEEAMAELEGILNAVEEGGVGLDDLGDKVARAATLIRTCQERIKDTEMMVQSILDELEDGRDASPEDPKP